MIKVLNLYAGIGGNRKLWKDAEVTAVENKPKIAEIYQKFFPEDNIIVADAHKFLLEYFQEFDFIWSSPPCPSHSRMHLLNVNIGQSQPKYPDMKLYEEIIFLQQFAECKWVVENVISYYDPLIKPQISGRHTFWANFKISNIKIPSGEIKGKDSNDMSRKTKRKGFDIRGLDLGHRKDQIMNNCVEPELGLHVFNCAFKDIQKTLGDI